MAVDKRPKLMIMSTRVTIEGVNFENPSECFIDIAHPDSRIPATKRKSHGDTDTNECFL